MKTEFPSGIDYFREPHKYIKQTLEMLGMNFDEICQHCSQYLLQKEINAKEKYHADCKKIVEAAAHQEKLIGDIHRANSRGGL